MKKLKSFASIIALVAVVLFMGVIGASSYLLQSKTSLFTLNSRASGSCNEGSWQTECMNPKERQSCASDAGVEQVFQCVSGAWVYKYPQCAQRCAPDAPTVKPGGDPECQGKTPGVIINECIREDCDTNIHQYVCVETYCDNNLKLQTKAGRQTGKTCGADQAPCNKGAIIEYCVRQECNQTTGKFDCIETYWGDDCKAQERRGTPTATSCTGGQVITGQPTIAWPTITPGGGSDGIIIQQPTPTPLPQPTKPPPTPTSLARPTTPVIPTPGCDYYSGTLCRSECSPVNCVKKDANCYYCPTDYVKVTPVPQVRYVCAEPLYTNKLICAAECPSKKCNPVAGIANCFVCPDDLKEENQPCEETGFFKTSSGQIVQCTRVGIPPKVLTESEYVEKQIAAMTSSAGSSCPPDKIGKKISYKGSCFSCVAPNVANFYSASDCQNEASSVVPPDNCQCSYNGQYIGTFCTKIGPCKPDKTKPSKWPAFTFSKDNCECTQGSDLGTTTYTWTGINCSKKGTSCEEEAKKEYEQSYLPRMAQLDTYSKETTLKKKMDQCKASRCVGTGTCMANADGTDVLCVPFSKTEKASFIPSGYGDAGQSCWKTETRTAGESRVQTTKVEYHCAVGRECAAGICIPDPDYEKTYAVAEALRQTKTMTAQERNTFITQNLGTDRKTADLLAQFSKNICEGCTNGQCVYSEKDSKYICLEETKIKQYFAEQYAGTGKETKQGELDGACIPRAPWIFAGGPKCNSPLLDCIAGTCQLKSEEVKMRLANDYLVQQGNNSDTVARGNLVLTGSTETVELMGDKTLAAPGCKASETFFSSGGNCWVCIDPKNKIMNVVDMQLCDKTIKDKIEAKLPGKQCHSGGGYCAPINAKCSQADSAMNDCVNEFKCCLPDQPGKDLFGETGLGLGEPCKDEVTKTYFSSGAAPMLAGKLLVHSCSSGLKCFEKTCREETTLAFDKSYQTQRADALEKIPILGPMIEGISTSATKEYYQSQTIRGHYTNQIATLAVNELQSIAPEIKDPETSKEVHASIIQQSTDAAARGQLLLENGDLNWGGRTGLRLSNWANAWNGNINENDVTQVVETEQYLKKLEESGARAEEITSVKNELTSLRWQAGMNIGLATVDVVGTVATLGGSSVLTKAGTTLAGQGMKFAVKEVVKEGAELAVKEGAEALVKQGAREGVELVAREGAKGFAGRALIATGRGLEYTAKAAEVVDKSQMVVFAGGSVASAVVLPAIQGKTATEILEEAPQNLLPGMSLVLGTQVGGKVLGKAVGAIAPPVAGFVDNALLASGAKKYTEERIVKEALQEAATQAQKQAAQTGVAVAEDEITRKAQEIARDRVVALGSSRVEKKLWETLHPPGPVTPLEPLKAAVESAVENSRITQIAVTVGPSSVSRTQIEHLQTMVGAGASTEEILRAAARDTSTVLGNTTEQKIAAAKGFVQARQVAIAHAPATLTSAQQTSLISGVSEVIDQAKAAGKTGVKLADAMDAIAEKTDGSIGVSTIYATVRGIEKTGAGIISSPGIRETLFSATGVVNKTERALDEAPNPFRGMNIEAIRAHKSFTDGNFADLQRQFNLTSEQIVALQEERIAQIANQGQSAANTLRDIQQQRYFQDFGQQHPDLAVRSREDLARQVLHDWNVVDNASLPAGASPVDHFTNPAQIDRALQYADELLAQNKARLAGAVTTLAGAGKVQVIPNQAARIIPDVSAAGAKIRVNGIEVPVSGSYIRRGDIVSTTDGTAFIYNGAGQFAERTSELAKKLGTTPDQLRTGLSTGTYSLTETASGARYLVGANNGRITRLTDSPGPFGGIRDTIGERLEGKLDEVRIRNRGSFAEIQSPSGARYLVDIKTGQTIRTANSPGLLGGLQDTFRETFGEQLDQVRTTAGAPVPVKQPSFISRARQSINSTINSLKQKRGGTPPLSPQPKTPKPKDIAKQIAGQRSPKDIEDILTFDPNLAGAIPVQLQNLTTDQIQEVQTELAKARGKTYTTIQTSDGILYVNKRTREIQIVKENGVLEEAVVDPTTGYILVDKGKVVRTKTGSVYLVEDDGSVTRIANSDRFIDRVKERYSKDYPEEVNKALGKDNTLAKDETEPRPTRAPEPTKPPKPTRAPEPTKPPKPTRAPEPTKPPKPTRAPEPTKPPRPTRAPEPTIVIPTRPPPLPPQKQQAENESFSYTTHGQQHGTIAIGRDQSNNILLADNNLGYLRPSRKHAEIVFEGGSYHISDLSTYGTFVNGELVGRGIKKPLKSGDVIRFARSEESQLIVHIDSATGQITLRKPLYEDEFYTRTFNGNQRNQITIGSGSQNNISIQNTPETAVGISYSGGKFTISGRGQVNGQPIGRGRVLQSGDYIDLGSGKILIVDIARNGDIQFKKPLDYQKTLASSSIENVVFAYRQLKAIGSPAEQSRYAQAYETRLAEMADHAVDTYIQTHREFTYDFLVLQETGYGYKVSPQKIESLIGAIQAVRMCKTGCSAAKGKAINARVSRYFPGKTIADLSESEMLVIAMRGSKVTMTGLAPNVVQAAKSEASSALQGLARKHSLTYVTEEEAEEISGQTMILFAGRGKRAPTGLAMGQDLLFLNKEQIKTPGEYMAVDIHEGIHGLQRQSGLDVYNTYSTRDPTYVEVMTEWLTKRTAGGDFFQSAYDGGVRKLNGLIKRYSHADIEAIEQFAIKGDSVGLRNWFAKKGVDIDVELQGRSDYDFYQDSIR